MGVGTGTSFVAVADFVLALGALADLAGTALPLRALSLSGYDRSRGPLDYTERVLKAGETFGIFRRSALPVRLSVQYTSDAVSQGRTPPRRFLRGASTLYFPRTP